MMVPGSTGRVIGSLPSSEPSPGSGFVTGAGDVVVLVGVGFPVGCGLAGSLVAGAGVGLLLGLAEVDTDAVADGDALVDCLRLGLWVALGDVPILEVVLGVGVASTPDTTVTVTTSVFGGLTGDAGISPQKYRLRAMPTGMQAT